MTRASGDPGPGGEREDIKALREHVDQYIESHKQEHELLAMAVVLAREVAEKELIKAHESMQHRLEGMNEFRSQIEHQTAEFVTRIEWTTAHENLREAMERDRTETKNAVDKAAERLNERLKDMTESIDGVKKLVWMGLGGVMAFSALMEYVFRGGK